MGVPYLGPRRRRAAPTPAAPVSLSASERSHRRKVVQDAQAAVLDNLDDDVARLIARRKHEVAQADPGVGDRVVQHATHDVRRLIERRDREKPEAVEVPPDPGVDVARLFNRRAREV